MITFTSLSGAARASRATPLSYLLQVDDVRILLDCGSPDWCPEASSSSVKTEDMDSAKHQWDQYCEALRECASSVDIVLLSHGDLQHTGLYAYAYAKWGLKAPAYTTLPVQALARVAVTEDVEGIRDEQNVDAVSTERSESTGIEGEGEEGTSMDVDRTTPSRSRNGGGKYIATLQEVHEAFDSLNVLRYSQPCHLSGKAQGITVTPFNAGHTLGGTIWKIRSPSAGTIMYAVNLNHMREHHLDGTVLLRPDASGIFEPLVRPDLLITDAERALVRNSRRKDRNDALIDTITSALSSRHSVLMPCDSSTRVLELLVLLDQYWTRSRLRYPICLLSRTGREMLTFVRSMMEWLGGTINKEDVGEEDHRRGQKRARDRGDDDDGEDALGALSLRFKHLEFFLNPQALLQTYASKDPKLILAVPASMSHGPSRAMFVDFACIPDNVILLTGRSEEGTLARQLFDRWEAGQRGDDRWDNGKLGRNIMLDGSLVLEMNAKVPLQGTELEIFLEKERFAKEKEVSQQAVTAQTDQRMLEADEDDDDTDSEEEEEQDEVERALGGNMLDLDSDLRGPAVSSRGARKKANRDADADWDVDADEGLSKTMLSFDIYLKGNASRATSFFRSADGRGERFRMFPHVEKKRRVDEYGETVDVGMWLRKGKVLEEADKDDKTEEIQVEDVPKAHQDPPSKFISSQVEVQLACRLLFVDLEGLNDGRAVKTIVPQINPRKMIIVHASSAAASDMISSCDNIRAMTKDIFAPGQGEEVKIGQQTSSFSITLSDEFLATIKMSSFEDNEVGFVTGRVSGHAGAVPALEPVVAGTIQKAMPGNILPARRNVLGARTPIALPHSTMIGDLKLTVLKGRLATIGIHADFVGEGVLICGRKGPSVNTLEQSVAVKKTGRGQVEMEGTVSEVYYIVRREVYKLHALVSQN